MPNYDYTCPNGHIHTSFVPYEARNHPQACPECDTLAQYEFPVTAALGYQPFGAYYDEALDVTFTSRGEKQSFLKEQNLKEAGDAVGGARNFDKHAPTHIGDKTTPRWDKTVGRKYQEMDMGRRVREVGHSRLGVVEGGRRCRPSIASNVEDREPWLR